MNRRTFSQICGGVFAAVFVTPFIPKPLQVKDKVLIDLKKYRAYLMKKIVPPYSDSIYIPVRPSCEDDVDIMIDSARELNSSGGFVRKIDVIRVQPYTPLESKYAPAIKPQITTIAATAQIVYPKLVINYMGLNIPYTTTLPIDVLRRA